MTSPAPLSRSAADSNRSLEVYSLGVVEFDSAWELQERLIYEISGRKDQSGSLLLCEHPPLVTMGRDASRAHLMVTEHELARCNVPLKWIGRGGGAFVHVPGQLAAYLLLPLDRLPVSVVEYRQRFETALAQACRDLQVPAKQGRHSQGLWSRGGQIAFFGAAVRSWVSCHGMFLNVSPWPGFLDFTVPTPGCERTTSLQALQRKPVRMGAVREAVARRLAEQFGYGKLHYYTGHPLLKRTKQRVCLHA